MIYAVWPHTEYRGEIVAVTYKDHWLVLKRYRKEFHAYEVFVDPNKIHRHYTKGVFWTEGTYMAPKLETDKQGQLIPEGKNSWGGITYRQKDMSHQGRFLGIIDFEDACEWYRVIEDPETHIRIGLL
jgi:hypothetical protein